MRTSLGSEGSGRAGWRQAALLACALWLAGCQGVTAEVERMYDSKLTPDRPVDWWHQLQGGPIAAQRPPPPGIDQPYPNFAKIPPKPAPINLASRHALVVQLITGREATEQADQQYPVQWPLPGAPSVPGQAAAKAPGKAGGATSGATSTAASDTSTMVFDAVTPTPTPVAPPPEASDPHPPLALVTPPASEAPVVSGPIPAIPTAAPPLPNLPGLPISVPIPVEQRAVPSALIRFERGSAALSEAAVRGLRELVARRAGAKIAVAAGGEARSASPMAQREALPLALARTGAITATLIAAGVPAGAISEEALAQGRDGSARLLN